VAPETSAKRRTVRFIAFLLSSDVATFAADAVNSNLVQGCNANVKGLNFVDFVMQVDFDNDDNDVAGLNFGWKSHEDYFRMHKHNDGWPNPSADLLPGPIMKVLRKMPDVPCDIFDPDYTNTCKDNRMQSLTRL